MGALAAAKHFLEVVKELDCEVCFIKKRIDMQSMLDKHGASYKNTETISQMKASLWARLFSGRSPLTEEAIQKRLIQGGFLEAVSEGTSLKEGVIFDQHAKAYTATMQHDGLGISKQFVDLSGATCWLNAMIELRQKNMLTGGLKKMQAAAATEQAVREAFLQVMESSELPANKSNAGLSPEKGCNLFPSMFPKCGEEPKFGPPLARSNVGIHGGCFSAFLAAGSKRVIFGLLFGIFHENSGILRVNSIIYGTDKQFLLLHAAELCVGNPYLKVAGCIRSSFEVTAVLSKEDLQFVSETECIDQPICVVANFRGNPTGDVATWMIPVKGSMDEKSCVAATYKPLCQRLKGEDFRIIDLDENPADVGDVVRELVWTRSLAGKCQERCVIVQMKADGRCFWYASLYAGDPIFRKRVRRAANGIPLDHEEEKAEEKEAQSFMMMVCAKAVAACEKMMVREGVDHKTYLEIRERAQRIMCEKETVMLADLHWIADVQGKAIRCTLSPEALEHVPRAERHDDAIYGPAANEVMTPHVYLTWQADASGHKYGHFNVVWPNPKGNVYVKQLSEVSRLGGESLFPREFLAKRDEETEIGDEDIPTIVDEERDLLRGVASALLMTKEYCSKILHGVAAESLPTTCSQREQDSKVFKTWELRSRRTEKVGQRIAFANEKRIWGTAKLVSCLHVAKLEGGTFVPVNDSDASKANFPHKPENYQYHQADLEWIKAQGWRNIWAYVLEDAKPFARPIPYHHSHQQQWITLTNPDIFKTPPHLEPDEFQCAQEQKELVPEVEEGQEEDPVAHAVLVLPGDVISRLISGVQTWVLKKYALNKGDVFLQEVGTPRFIAKATVVGVSKYCSSQSLNAQYRKHFSNEKSLIVARCSKESPVYANHLEGVQAFEVPYIYRGTWSCNLGLISLRELQLSCPRQEPFAVIFFRIWGSYIRTYIHTHIHTYIHTYMH